VNPKRVQRKRVKGWRMPDGAVYVGRPTRWGNPNALRGSRYVDDIYGEEHYCDVGEARGVAVRLFREHLLFDHLSITVEDVKAELRGRDLACWCPLDDQPCHADVLLDIANELGGER
jgi:hypothetical protein